MLKLWKSGGIRFFSHENVNIQSRVAFLFCEHQFPRSEAVMADGVRLVSVWLVIKMVLAVQRSCLVLISGVGFLGIGIERMTHFIKGTGRGCCVVSIISKELFLFLSH